MLSLEFTLDILDLRLQSFVLRHLSRQKALRKQRLLSETARRQGISIGHFPVRFAEAVHLHETFVDERVQTIIHTTEANAEAAREFPLADVWVRLDQAHQAKTDILIGRH